MATWADDQFTGAGRARTLPHMRRSRRRSVLALLGSAGAAAIALPIVALGGPGPQAPDLRADPVERVSGPEFFSTGGIGAGRLLVRFDGFVTNIGQGPVEIRGNPQIPGDVKQYARNVTGGPVNTAVGTPPIVYDEGDGHDHFHLMRVMRYSLWNAARTGPAAPGQKVGFCLYDIEPALPPTPPPQTQTYTEVVTEFCESGDEFSTSLRMGTSVGWRDVYDKTLAYQWVDVSDTAPGSYWVASEADPDNVVWEGGGAAEGPSLAFGPTPVTVPGWLAQPLSAPRTGAPQAITLQAQKFGAQGDASRRFRIVSPPAHGTLSVAPGQDFASPTITYTPNPGDNSPDSFTYAGVYNGWGYPTVPVPATVTLTSAAPSVTISGAPASLVAGTSAQLTANVANLPAGVGWSATAGTISAAGLYTAPAAPPAGGAVTVTARSTAAPAIGASAAIAITPARKPVPRPGVFGTLTAGNKLISPLAIRRINRRVFVSKIVTGRKAGRVAITATLRSKVLGRCVARLPARRAFTCKLRLKRNYPLKRVRVTARFTAKGGRTAVRRSFVIR